MSVGLWNFLLFPVPLVDLITRCSQEDPGRQGLGSCRRMLGGPGGSGKRRGGSADSSVQLRVRIHVNTHRGSSLEMCWERSVHTHASVCAYPCVCGSVYMWATATLCLCMYV